MSSQLTQKRAVFLDRDGTLNIDPGYISRPEQLHLLPRTQESLARLKEAGFLLIVITNQSGVGRGIISLEMLPEIHARLDQLIAPAKIDSFECCIHRPEDKCECRKPKPKLIVDAALRYGIDLSQSYMVGDKIIDVQAGHAARCKASILVRTGHGLNDEPVIKQFPPEEQPEFIANSIWEATDWILNSKNAST